jgi:hypothetical protein
MRLITRLELAERSDSELSHLFWEVSRELARSDIGSAERRNALASLENITHERAWRLGFVPHRR